MLPRVIIHNSVSLDGSFINIEPDMGIHYQIAGSYSPQAHLIGSNTVVKGFEMFGSPPPEEKKDFSKPERDKSLPLWVIIDTGGKLKGLLHGCRSFEYCRDVMVLVSEKTPGDYLEYLKERDYDYRVAGKDKVDLNAALELLYMEYNVRTLLTDTGRILSNLLINQGLVDEISLVVCPVVVGNKSENLFSELDGKVGLEMVKCQDMGNGHVWLAYKLGKPG